MLLIVALLVAILFGGLTFLAHIVWFGLIAGLVVAIAVHVSKSVTRGA